MNQVSVLKTILSAVLCVTLLPTARCQCPAGCTCTMTSLYCVNIALKTIPSGMPSWPSTLETIFIDGACIDTIIQTDVSSYPVLTSFQVVNSQVTVVADDTFDGISGLETVNFSRNKLTSFNIDMLNDSSLNSLDLSDNPNLQTLSKGLKHGLGQNPLFSATLLDLTNCPLHCNCDLEWLEKLKIQISDIRAVCNSPAAHAGIDYVNVNKNDFLCTNPSIISISPPSPLYVAVGDSFILSCEASGDAAPELTWNVPGDSPTTQSPIDISVSSLFYNLTIASAQLSHNGTWTCTATNSQGSVTSAPLTVIIMTATTTTIPTTQKSMTSEPLTTTNAETTTTPPPTTTQPSTTSESPQPFPLPTPASGLYGLNTLVLAIGIAGAIGALLGLTCCLAYACSKLFAFI